MTEKEAIQQLEFDREMILFDPTTGENMTLEVVKALNKDNYFTYLADGIAILALKEIQQYRAIGTVEEVEQNARDLKRQIEHSEHLAEVLKSTKSLLEKRGRLLSDYCKIGTVEECREAVEKQKPKKIIRIVGRYPYKCPTCNGKLEIGYRHCIICGQLLRYPYENLEEMEDE